jgi:hypothetical protein
MAEGKSVTGRIKAGHGKDHHRGFNDAFEHALEQASKELGTGNYQVAVEHTANVQVSNPGVIGYYEVKLTRIG